MPAAVCALGQSSSNMHKLLRFFGEPTLALGASVSDWQQAGIAEKGLAIYQDWQNGQDKDIQLTLSSRGEWKYSDFFIMLNSCTTHRGSTGYRNSVKTIT